MDKTLKQMTKLLEVKNQTQKHEQEKSTLLENSKELEVVPVEKSKVEDVTNVMEESIQEKEIQIENGTLNSSPSHAQHTSSYASNSLYRNIVDEDNNDKGFGTKDQIAHNVVNATSNVQESGPVKEKDKELTSQWQMQESQNKYLADSHFSSEKTKGQAQRKCEILEGNVINDHHQFLPRNQGCLDIIKKENEVTVNVVHEPVMKILENTDLQKLQSEVEIIFQVDQDEMVIEKLKSKEGVKKVNDNTVAEEVRDIVETAVDSDNVKKDDSKVNFTMKKSHEKHVDVGENSKKLGEISCSGLLDTSNHEELVPDKDIMLEKNEIMSVVPQINDGDFITEPSDEQKLNLKQTNYVTQSLNSSVHKGKLSNTEQDVKAVGQKEKLKCIENSKVKDNPMLVKSSDLITETSEVSQSLSSNEQSLTESEETRCQQLGSDKKLNAKDIEETEMTQKIERKNRSLDKNNYNSTVLDVENFTNSEREASVKVDRTAERSSGKKKRSTIESTMRTSSVDSELDEASLKTPSRPLEIMKEYKSFVKQEAEKIKAGTVYTTAHLKTLSHNGFHKEQVGKPLSGGAKRKYSASPADTESKATPRREENDEPPKLETLENESYKKPFQHGWKREIVFRAVVEGKLQNKKGRMADIYYSSPTGQKLRSIKEVQSFMEKHPSFRLPLEYFTYAKYSVYHEPLEIHRLASTKSKTLEIISSTPTKRKRVSTSITPEIKVPVPKAKETPKKQLDGSVTPKTEKRCIPKIKPTPTATGIRKKSLDNIVSKGGNKYSPRIKDTPIVQTSAQKKLSDRVFTSKGELRCGPRIKYTPIVPRSTPIKLSYGILKPKRKKKCGPKIKFTPIRLKEGKSSPQIQYFLQSVIKIPKICIRKLDSEKSVQAQDKMQISASNNVQDEDKMQISASNNVQDEDKMQISANKSIQDEAKKQVSANKSLQDEVKQISSNKSMQEEIKTQINANKVKKPKARKKINPKKNEQVKHKKHQKTFSLLSKIKVRSSKAILCSLHCMGRNYELPSLHCGICLCLFHPECVGIPPSSCSSIFICQFCRKNVKGKVLFLPSGDRPFMPQEFQFLNQTKPLHNGKAEEEALTPAKPPAESNIRPNTTIPLPEVVLTQDPFAKEGSIRNNTPKATVPLKTSLASLSSLELQAIHPFPGAPVRHSLPQGQKFIHRNSLAGDNMGQVSNVSPVSNSDGVHGSVVQNVLFMPVHTQTSSCRPASVQVIQSPSHVIGSVSGAVVTSLPLLSSSSPHLLQALSSHPLVRTGNEAIVDAGKSQLFQRTQKNVLSPAHSTVANTPLLPDGFLVTNPVGKPVTENTNLPLPICSGSLKLQPVTNLVTCSSGSNICLTPTVSVVPSSSIAVLPQVLPLRGSVCSTIPFASNSSTFRVQIQKSNPVHLYKIDLSGRKWLDNMKTTSTTTTTVSDKNSFAMSKTVAVEKKTESSLTEEVPQATIPFVSSHIETPSPLPKEDLMVLESEAPSVQTEIEKHSVQSEIKLKEVKVTLVKLPERIYNYSVRSQASKETLKMQKPKPSLCYINQLVGGFDCINYIFQYLGVADLLRASQVSRSWRNIARQSNLWKSVCLKDLYITNWARCTRTLQQFNTTSLDLRDVKHIEDCVTFWHYFIQCLEDLRNIRFLTFGEVVPEVLPAVFETITQLRSLTAECVTEAMGPSVWTMLCKIDFIKIRRLTNLNSLWIRSGGGLRLSPLLSSGSIRCLGNLNMLRHLHLTTLVGAPSESFQFIEKLLLLESLAIGNCYFWNSWNYACLGKLKHLKKLRLEKGGQLNDPGLQNALSNLTLLEELQLLYFVIPSNLGSALQKLQNLSQLVMWPDIYKQAPRVNQNTLEAVYSLKMLSKFSWGVMSLPSETNNEDNTCDKQKIIPFLRHKENCQWSSIKNSSKNQINPECIVRVHLEELEQQLRNLLTNTRITVYSVPLESFNRFCSAFR
ncbi:uncharacterized protein LOC106457245 [Limulus polyphemus]|uniref:Uncharacterized protein LOC106457245 n=1 Tax=Limulus polyphemus TaxID=6850 RepID=A0ABM1S583_LIMPO|nr:uncharacterized protein LOC106457245 [Limulus polyphemus]XP_022238789.1 uncharacterized protein LOC106457245 [Limulus polyphemus]XP_022238790.1 uncharacterized protein LOC106457245 [Limulus polyphemus]